MAPVTSIVKVYQAWSKQFQEFQKSLKEAGAIRLNLKPTLEDMIRIVVLMEELRKIL